MASTLSLTFKPSFHHQNTPFLNSHNYKLIKSNPSYLPFKPFKQPTIKITASTTTTTVSGDTKPRNNPIIHSLKLTARAVIFTAAAVSFKFHHYPAIAEPIADTIAVATTESENHIPEFLESNSESISETGEPKLAREALEEILTRNPLSFEALFENALLMDRCGEGETVIKRLEHALEKHNEKEAKDVKLIIAQIQFLQKNVDEALKRYDEIISEDPNDFRPYFCKGMIYSFIDKNDEAKVQFDKYRELSPKKFEVEGILEHH